MKRESNSVKFGYPTLIWLQDYLNLENSFFKGNNLLSKASSIAPNMPSCFLKRQIGLAKVFHKSSSPPSKGFLDLTPHKFKSITQKSEQKYFKLLFYFGSCFFSVISTFFNFFPAAICCKSPDLITRTVLVFMNMLLLLFGFFTSRCFVCFTQPCIDLLGSRSGGRFQSPSLGNLLLYCQSSPVVTSNIT